MGRNGTMVDVSGPLARGGATAGSLFGFREYPSVWLNGGDAVMSNTLRFMSRAAAAKRTNARNEVVGGGPARPAAKEVRDER